SACSTPALRSTSVSAIRKSFVPSGLDNAMMRTTRWPFASTATLHSAGDTTATARALTTQGCTYLPRRGFSSLTHIALQATSLVLLFAVMFGRDAQGTQQG